MFFVRWDIVLLVIVWMFGWGDCVVVWCVIKDVWGGFCCSSGEGLVW